MVSNAAGGPITSDIGALTVSNPAITNQPSASQSVAAGATATFSAAAAGSPVPTYQWKKNGVALANGTNIAGATTSTLTLSNVQTADAATYTLVASNTSGTATSNNAVLTIQAPTPPAITTQPVSQTLTTGSTAQFTVAASGSPVPTYQWKFNGINLVDGAIISGSATATLSLTNLALATGGTYSVVATNTAGNATSNGAILTVQAAQAAPAITTQPSNQTVTAGSPATFSVTATGSPTPTYQWKKGSTNVGTNSNTYSIASTVAGDAGSYTVVVSNGIGSPVTSTAATLTVSAAAVKPAITTQPSNKTVLAGNSITMTAAASGTPAPTLQWQKGGVNVSGQTSGTLSLSNVQASDAGTYTLVATNSAGTATSNGAVLTVVTAAPSITTQPLSQTVNAGTTATLTGAANGSPAPVLQWQKNGANISGASSGTLTLSNVSSADAGTYKLFATNSAGSVSSIAAVITINTPPTVTLMSYSQTVFSGASTSFSVTVSGTPAPTYQWQLSTDATATWTNLTNDSTYSGTTTATLTITGSNISMSGYQYRCIVTNSVATIPTQPLVLSVSLLAECVDFDHDGKAEALWHNTSTGLVSSWTTANGFSVFGVEGGGWQVIGMGDYDGDGKADVLWHNAATLLVASWTSSSGFVPFGTEGGGWIVIGSGDFDGDGRKDILWHNIYTGRLVASWTSGAGYLSLDNEGGGWSVIGVGDFNGDHRDDILWHNTITHSVNAIYTGGGGHAFSAESATSQVIGIGDFDGDGNADVLWRNPTTGVVTAELSSGGFIPIYTEAGGWQVIGTGDFDGDGFADVLLRNTTTGAVTAQLHTGSILSIGAEGSGWSVIP